MQWQRKNLIEGTVIIIEDLILNATIYIKNSANSIASGVMVKISSKLVSDYGTCIDTVVDIILMKVNSTILDCSGGILTKGNIYNIVLVSDNEICSGQFIAS